MRIENEIELRKELIKSIIKQREEIVKLTKATEDEVLGIEDWMLASFKASEDVIATGIDSADIIETLSDNAFKENEDRIEREKRHKLEAAELDAELSEIKIAQANEVFNILGALTKENAEAQQAIAISQAIINGALQITKIGSQAGVLALPLQILAGLQTLAQIATIRAQKFERGGFDVLRGRRHEQGGIAIGLGEEAEDGEGRAIFSRHAMKKYGKFLPAFTKDINDGRLDVSENGSYNFNYDDSRSVGKLEAIRELLSKPDVRYENGYRIETRKGQRTKVKV